MKHHITRLVPFSPYFGREEEEGEKSEAKSASSVKNMDISCLNILHHTYPDILKQDILKWKLTACMCLIQSCF